MSKTKELVIKCEEVRCVPDNYKKLVLHIDTPDVNDALLGFHSDDLTKFVSDNYGIEEVFSKEQLEKWATENGYIKE